MRAQRLTVVLTTAGRRSGAPRTVTLYGFPDGDRVVVVGSRGGAAHHPAWVHNLRAEPMASLQAGKHSRPVRAHEAEGTDRDRLWKLVTGAFPLYAAYQRRTKRIIPLFILEPVTDHA